MSWLHVAMNSPDDSLLNQAVEPSIDSSQSKKTIDITDVELDAVYPRSGSAVSGLTVMDGEIPNMGSIPASFNNYEILNGIREVQMSMFGGPKTVFYAADDFKRSRDLAETIHQSQQIMPLIIAVDDEGPYILEGAHRYVALFQLGIKSFPAVVVLDLD